MSPRPDRRPDSRPDRAPRRPGNASGNRPGASPGPRPSRFAPSRGRPSRERNERSAYGPPDPGGGRYGADRPPGERRFIERRPAEGRSFEGRPPEGGDRRPTGRPSPVGRGPDGRNSGGDSPVSRFGSRREGGRPSSFRPVASRPSGDRPYAERSSAQRRPYEGRPGERRAFEGRPSYRRSNDEHRNDGPRGDGPRSNGPRSDDSRYDQRRPRLAMPAALSQAAPAGEVRGEADAYAAAAPSDLIWGRHATQAILESGRPIHRIWCTSEMRFTPRFLPLLRDAKASGVLVEEVTWARLGQLTGGAVHQGIVLQPAAADTLDLPSLIDGCRGIGESALLIAVDGLTDPQNLGAIVRSAEALGAHGMVLPQRRNAGLTGSVAKVAAGALEHLPVARVVNLNRALDALKQEGYRVVGLAEDGNVSLEEVDLEGALVLVTGSEGSGLSMLTRRSCDQLVRIPLRGATPSLNASVATALLLYEVARRGWMRGLRGSAPAPRIVRPSLPTTAPEHQEGSEPETIPPAAGQSEPQLAVPPESEPPEAEPIQQASQDLSTLAMELLPEQDGVEALEPDPLSAATASPSSNGASSASDADTAETPTNGFHAAEVPNPEPEDPGPRLIEALPLPLLSGPDQSLGGSFEADVTL